jgi:hypothetical protein
MRRYVGYTEQHIPVYIIYTHYPTTYTAHHNRLMYHTHTAPLCTTSRQTDQLTSVLFMYVPTANNIGSVIGIWNVCVCGASVEWCKTEVLWRKPRPSATLHENPPNGLHCDRTWVSTVRCRCHRLDHGTASNLQYSFPFYCHYILHTSCLRLKLSHVPKITQKKKHEYSSTLLLNTLSFNYSFC